MSELPQIPPGAAPGALNDEAQREREKERKRKRSQICKASRERIQQDKNVLRDHIAKLEAEIAEKKKTSASLEQTRNKLSLEREHLKDKKTGIQHRQAELKKEVDDQNKQLEELSKHSNFGRREFQTLSVELSRNILTVWSQTDWDKWPSEKTELEEEISELETKNSELEKMKQVLVEYIIHRKKQGNP